MNKGITAWLVIASAVMFSLTANASDWGTDFARASTNASKSGLYMLLDFSGSDWCGWCMKLDKEVFSRPAFKEYAKKNLVCVLVDFPHQKKQSKKLKEQNAELAKEYAIRGYPSVVILSPEGELVGKTGYREGGAQAYVEHLKEMIGEHKKLHPKQEENKQAPSDKVSEATSPKGAMPQN